MVQSPQIFTVSTSRCCGDRIVGRAMIGAVAILVVGLGWTPRVHAQAQRPDMTGSFIAHRGVVETDFFTTSERCAMCHSSARGAKALRDAQGRSVAPSDLWPTSMMANSSVDPFWRAVVAAEIAATPSRQAEIEAKCLRCHTPMASIEAEFAGITPSRERFLHGDTTLARLAADGVSCTFCHQIPPDGLGADESFSGHFRIGMKGKIYGPHSRPFAMPMYRHTGYVPTASAHVSKSALCAACHTLFTNSLSPDGTPTGHMLLEQGPYVEWQNSQFNNESRRPNRWGASCQDCHMPTRDFRGNPIKTRIARNPHGGDFPPVRPRAPIGQHVFTGGNTLVLSMLRDELGRTGFRAGAARFDLAIQLTLRMLRENTAKIEIVDVERRDQQLAIDVAVSNLAGHKLPTAYPSRRVWLHLRVQDAAGEVVFESGEFDRRGRIVDGAGEVLSSERAGGPVVSHLATIRSPDQVQIYEALMDSAEEELTYSLLRGARYRKDNRLLPQGWVSDHPRGPTTAPVGTDDDPNFIAGSDTVLYVVDAPPRRGPYQIEAALYYQVLGARYAAELFTNDVPEMNAFHKLYAASDPRPAILDLAEPASAE